MGRVIFCEGIVEPPTETLAIRGLCLYLNVFGRKSEILLEDGLKSLIKWRDLDKKS